MRAELFGFLSCPPNREVAPVHPKAMPVILTKPEELRQWLTAPVADALRLHPPSLLPFVYCERHRHVHEAEFARVRTKAAG